MELRVYDPELNLLGITENQTSVIWTRRFNDVGEFQIYLPLTDENVKLYDLDNIVSFRGANEAGVIEDVSRKRSDTERRLLVKGRFLSSYMDRRLIRPRVNFSGKVEVAMRKLLDDAEPLPQVELGELQGYTDTVEFQATYKNLLDYEKKLSLASNIGFRFRPDFTTKTIYFECFKGYNRTRNQSERAFVEFSDKFDNLNKIEQRRNNQLQKTVGYVGGEGEGEQRTIEVVGDDTLTGLARREMFVDASDISSDGLTTAQYLAMLRERGNTKLNACVLSDSIECDTIPEGNYRYKVDYDLGDIVTVRQSEWGMSVDMRITEITEVYERGNMMITPTFGSPLPTTVKWEDS